MAKRKDPSWKKIKAASEAPQEIAPKKVRNDVDTDITYAEAYLPQDMTRRAMHRVARRSVDSSWYVKHPLAPDR